MNRQQQTIKSKGILSLFKLGVITFFVAGFGGAILSHLIFFFNH